ncbi:MAG TPA: signal peptidase I [Fimbriimonadaceae bacterium]|nr:signal peptidase I [Fimbriimonadaceae bacterium]
MGSLSLAGHLFAQQSSPTGWADTIDKAARTPQSHVIIVVLILTVVRLALYLYTKDVPAHLRHTGYKTAQFINECCDAVVYAGIFVFLIIRPYFVQAFRIPSGSMISTLLVNDFIVANKLIYRYTDPQHGDIVVFRPPPAAVRIDPTQIDPDGQVNVDFIKRCIGVPGDLIEVKDDVLYRNGEAVQEPYKHFTRPPEFTDVETVEERSSEAKPNFKLVVYKGKYYPVTIDGSVVNDTDRFTSRDYAAPDGEAITALRDGPPAKIPPGFYLMLGDNRNGSYDGRAWGLVPRSDIVGRAEWIWWPMSRFGGIKSK